MTINRSLSICTLLFCVVAPATLYASADSPAPEATSFAYPVSHPVKPLPADAVEQVADDSASDDEARAYAPKPVETGLEPRPLTRNGVCSAVASVARANDLPIPFFANLIWQESSFNSNTVSRAGAQGIAQFMPKTAAEFGLVNPFEPIEALHAAGRFLSRLRAQFGNLGLAAAAYNAGPGRVIDWMTRRKKLPGETRNYVLRITGRAADQWTAIDPRRNPEARLMPARAPCIEVTEAVAHQAKAVRVTRLMSELAAAAGSKSARNAPASSNRDEEAPLIVSAPPQRKRSALKVASGVLKVVQQRRTQRTVAAAELPERPAGRLDAAMAPRPATPRRVVHIAAPPVKSAARKTAPQVAKAAAPKPEKPAVAHNHAPARRTRVASAR